ncbi:hypothetical protein GALMADRAFT_229201 [Galerina marginata CBS 339.88]|uniref:Terpene synthase n=1 Tax=Galerina marginata (strain CBS 339.88) TaxID=685588 RepID=A0A067SWF3_GALM3|nr:hypothetical protein GALMADRAFT_229201 [Galerina marginata CBS 339.88]
MTTSILTFRLPRLEDTFSVFPHNGINHHFSECRDQSREWIDKFLKIALGPKMCIFLSNCNLELNAAYTHPNSEPDGLRAVMDYLNVAWTYDEFTDDLAGEEAAQAAAVFGSNVAPRFIDHFCQAVEKTGAEADLREKDQILDLDGYISLRRGTVAVRVVFDLVEYCLGLDLPQYVHEDPAFISAYNAGIDLIAWTNDLFSYNMEQAKGHSGANIITVVMECKGISLQSAIDFVAGYCECLTQQFVWAKAALTLRTDPIFSKDAVRCLEAYGDWIKGNDEWSFATERYFGKENALIKKTRIVELRKPFEGAIRSTE